MTRVVQRQEHVRAPCARSKVSAPDQPLVLVGLEQALAAGLLHQTRDLVAGEGARHLALLGCTRSSAQDAVGRAGVQRLMSGRRLPSPPAAAGRGPARPGPARRARGSSGPSRRGRRAGRPRRQREREADRVHRPSGMPERARTAARAGAPPPARPARRGRGSRAVMPSWAPAIISEMSSIATSVPRGAASPPRRAARSRCGGRRSGRTPRRRRRRSAEQQGEGRERDRSPVAPRPSAPPPPGRGRTSRRDRSTRRPSMAIDLDRHGDGGAPSPLVRTGDGYRGPSPTPGIRPSAG